MNDIRIFDNQEFGKVRTVIIGEKEYFYGVDIAAALMYKRPRKAITDNCKGVLTQDSLLNNGGYPELLITEGDIYRLTIKAGQQNTSKEIKDKAERFEKWIFDEVLPALRKTGTYAMPSSPLDVLELHYQAIKQVDQKVEAIDSRVDALKDELEQVKADMPLFGVEETRIVQAVHRRSIELMGGSGSNASKSRWMKKRVSQYIYDELHRVFGVRTYKALKRSQCDSAVKLINEYVLPEKVAAQIDQSNAQMNLGEWNGDKPLHITG